MVSLTPSSSKRWTVLAHQGVLGLGEDTAQGIAVQRVEICDDGQTAHNLGYQAVGAEVLGCDVAQEVVAVDAALLLLSSVAHNAGVEPLGDLLLDTLEGASADKQDIGRVHGYHLLLRVLAAAGGGNVDDAALEEFQHGLLEGLSLLRAILSISSMKTMPLSARATS